MFRRTSLIGVCVSVCLALGVLTGTAQASDGSLLAAAKTGVANIERSQVKILRGLANYQKTHSVSSLVKAIKSQDRVLKAFETKLAAQSASSTKGNEAKTELMAGLKLIVSSNTTLAKELKLKAAGRPVSNAKVSAAEKQDLKGNKELGRGLKLLASVG